MAKSPKGRVSRAPKGSPTRVLDKVLSDFDIKINNLNQRINEVKVIEGPAGQSGTDGAPGKDGEVYELTVQDMLSIRDLLKRDKDFKDELKGEDGKDGNDGASGGGGGGITPTFRYIPIRSASYTVAAVNTVQGTNVLGVDYAGDVTINLPVNFPRDRVLVINDESGDAGSNNITVTTI